MEAPVDSSVDSLVDSVVAENTAMPPESEHVAPPSSADLPLPLDLSDLVSEATKMRAPNRNKQFYKFFQTPGSGNLAGGLPHVSFFPYDTLEAQISKPNRFAPSLETIAMSADGTSTDDEDDDDDGDAVLIAGKLAATKLAAAPSKSVSAVLSSSTTTTGSGSLVSGSETPVERLDPVHLQIPKSAPARVPAPSPDRKIDLATALQYGLSEGYAPLLAWVRNFTRNHVHPNVPYRGGPEVIMTVGSTDGLSKTYELFIDNWNPKRDDIRDRPGLLVEPFIYGAPLTQGTSRGLQVVTVEADEQGMRPDGPGGLEDVLANWDSSRGRRPHLLYIVSLGHNPTGIVIQLERRKALYDICSRYNVIIIEDEPYWHLQYPSVPEAEAASRNLPKPAAKKNAHTLAPGQKSSGYAFLDSLAPSFLSIDVDGRVIRLDTFSKTVAPGCRLGWITAQPALIDLFGRITEGTTSQPSGFVQSLLSELVRGPLPALSRGDAPGSDLGFSGWQTDGWVRWLEGLRGVYERRLTEVCTILDNGAFQLKQGTPVRPSDADWGVITKTQVYSFDWPRAGMFIWLRMLFEAHPLWQAPRSDGTSLIDGPSLQMALMVLLVSKPHLVVVAPGSIFSSNDEVRSSIGWAYFRLCFAAESHETLVASTHRFVAAIQKFWKIKKVRDMEELIDKSPFAASELEQATNIGSWIGC